jgi:hypothetical protein
VRARARAREVLLVRGLTLSRPLSRKNWSAWKRRKLFVFFLTLGRRTAGVGPFTISAGGGADDEEGGKGEEVPAGEKRKGSERL